jgi:hypothetical protein
MLEAQLFSVTAEGFAVFFTTFAAWLASWQLIMEVKELELL